MIGRLRVVADDTPSQMWSARWLTAYVAPLEVATSLPAPQVIWRLMRNGSSVSEIVANSPARVTR